jgi:hypothetical protein
MKQHLQQFAQQLATWTAEIIDRGRTPFRRVETCAQIETEVGSIEIALIFWINRQSLMAGGLVLIPEDSLEEDLERGRHAAQSLGLSHFVTWEKTQVRIWHCEQSGISEQQVFPLKDPNYLETFRFVLEDLLEALKLTAVLGAVPVPKLSASYFHNLAQITLQRALPSLVEAYRSHRSGDGQNLNMDIDTCAKETSHQILLQILALLWLGDIPATILPENLQQTLESAIKQLPEGIREPLSLKALEDAPALPLEASVSFHHFLLRLRQLSWDSTNGRIKKTLSSLSNVWFPVPNSNHVNCITCLYPVAPPMMQVELVLSESPSLLSMTALQHYYDETQPLALKFNHMFKLDKESFPHSAVTARLLNERTLTTQERGEFVTQLRKSWPHRRFKIKTGQPFWLWEFIHLLGICQQKQPIDLLIPHAALQTAADGYIWTLLSEQYCIHNIQKNDKNLKIELSRNPQKETPALVHYQAQIREITVTTSIDQFRNNLLLALELPQTIYRLIGQELIWLKPTEQSIASVTGMEIYQQTRCYQLIESIVASSRLDITNQSTADEDISLSFPWPETTLLKQLFDEQQTTTTSDHNKTTDQLLADILFCPEVEEIELPSRPRRTREYDKNAPDQKQLKSFILQQAEGFGIPNFPEQYLYFLEDPKMKSYKIVPPLTEINQFLGEFTLEDAQGQTINGFGEELKLALLFCSQTEKERFELPSDREQLNIMLQHYKKDLLSLYEHIGNITYSHHENAKEARKLLGKAWKKLNLPTPAWFKN